MYEFSGFRLDPRSRRLFRGGEAVPVTVKAFDTLVVLVERAGHVVEKEELMRRVWPDAIVEDANLSQQIFLLRRALGEGPREHRFIQTVPRRGFRFVAEVLRPEEATRERATAPAAAADLAARWRSPHRPHPLRLQLTLDRQACMSLGACPPFALSPDGRRLAYVASDAGTSALYLRPLDRIESMRLPRTEGAEAPFFSPDGRWIAFFAGGRLCKLFAAGGTPIVLCETGMESRGAAWTTRDEIVFAQTPASGLVRVSAEGGPLRPATGLDFSSGERTHRWPHALPDGRHVLFTVARAGTASFDEAEIAVASLETGERRVVVRHGSCPRYVPTGHLAYMRGGSIVAVEFDAERLEASGPAIPVVDSVMTQPTGAGHFTFSREGSLLYLTGDAHHVRRRLVWAGGGGVPEPLRVQELAIEEPRLSPDGGRVAFGVRGATSDIWIHALQQQTMTRATFEGDNFAPIWTPDGARLTFSSNRHGPCHIFWQPAEGGDPEKIVGSDHDLVAGCWSARGELLFTEYHPGEGACIWICAPRGGDAARPLIRAHGNAFSPVLAPHRGSFAYASDASGRLEVYVASFPEGRAPTQISMDGGTEPVWSPDGSRLYFRSGPRVLSVLMQPDGLNRRGEARLEIEGPYQPGAMTGLSNYDVAADGRLLLIAQCAEQAQPDHLSVVVHWFGDLLDRLAWLPSAGAADTTGFPTG